MRYKIETPYPELHALLQSLATDGLPEGCEIVYSGRNIVARINHPTLGALSIKEFKVPHFINRIVYTNFRAGKARRSFEHAGILLAAGIGTPEPLGYVEVKSGLLLSRSYYVCRHLDGYTDMRPWNITAADDTSVLATDLGHLIASLRQNDIWVKDFSQGNILRRRRTDGHYDLALIDINRMQLQCSSPKKSLDHFKRFTEDDAMIRGAARAYAEALGLNPAAAEEDAMAVRKNFLRK